MKIAVFFGGCSDEYAVSLLSAASVLSALDPQKYEPISIGITRTGAWLYTEASPASIAADAWQHAAIPCALSPDPTQRGLRLADGRTLCPDLIFPLLHGGAGEDGRMAGLFSLSGIPYLGARTEGAALAMNKALAKSLVREAGVPTLPFFVASPCARERAKENAAKMGYPLFVKPLHGGSSVGAARVRGEEEFLLALLGACAGGDGAIVEPYFPAREIELALLCEGGKLSVSQPGEIAYGGGGFYDYETKYTRGRAKLSLAKLSPLQNTRVRTYAEKVFSVLSLTHLARVDFFLRGDDIYFNEVNTLPGFTEGSMYPFLLANGDLSRLCDRLIGAALAV